MSGKHSLLNEHRAFSAQASKTAQLIASSARCSKRRLYPLELLGDSEVGLSASPNLKKVKLEHEKHVASGMDEHDNNHPVLGNAPTSAKRGTAMTVTANSYSILGFSSAQPLRMRAHSRVVHAKQEVFRFVGDKQPSTDIAIANLFSAHPSHKVAKIVNEHKGHAVAVMPVPDDQGGQNVGAAVALQLAGSTQASAQETQQDQHTAAHHSTSSSNAAGSSSSASSSSAPIAGTLSPVAVLQHGAFPEYCFRTVYAQNDESINLAGTDAEAPSAALLEYVRDLAFKKLVNALSKHKTPVVPGMVSGTGFNEQGIENRMDSTALVAVSVLVEELVRDMMVNWYQRGAPLGFDARNLRTEALAQMNGAPEPKAISTELLQNRLEVLFGRDLDYHKEEIKVFRKVAILGSKPAPTNGRKSAKKGEGGTHSGAQVVPPMETQ